MTEQRHYCSNTIRDIIAIELCNVDCA